VVVVLLFLASHFQLIGQGVSGREAVLQAEDASFAISLGAVASARGMDKRTPPFSQCLGMDSSSWVGAFVFGLQSCAYFYELSLVDRAHDRAKT
jgi:hypothetical protein